MKPGFLPLIAVVLALLSAACSLVAPPDRSLEQVRASGRLRVGIDPSYPPFDFVDGNQQLVGFDDDLAREIARRLGVAADFVAIDVGTIFDGLTARKYDLVVSAIGPAPDLSKEVAFSSPYFNAGQALVVPKSSGLHLSSLAGRTIGVEMGSGGEAALRQTGDAGPAPTIRVYDSASAALAATARAEVEGAVIDVLTALDLLKDQPDLQVVAPPITSEPYVVAARARDRALLDAVEQTLAELRQDGFLTGLERRWLAELPEEWE